MWQHPVYTKPFDSDKTMCIEVLSYILRNLIPLLLKSSYFMKDTSREI